MASERQIAANRRNARESTGPRSNAGKARARHNAYQHGFRARTLYSATADEQIAELTRAIAGDKNDSRLVQEWATTAAEAIHNLARLRRLKGVLIDEIRDGRHSPDCPKSLYQLTETDNMLNRVAMEIPRTLGLVKRLRALIHPRQPVPQAPANHYQQLRKLDRYEQHLSARRDEAIGKIVRHNELSQMAVAQSSPQLGVSNLPNEPNFL